MEVTGLSADTFWKGETEIRGEVTDGTERYSCLLYTSRCV